MMNNRNRNQQQRNGEWAHQRENPQRRGGRRTNDYPQFANQKPVNQKDLPVKFNYPSAASSSGSGHKEQQQPREPHISTNEFYDQFSKITSSAEETSFVELLDRLFLCFFVSLFLCFFVFFVFLFLCFFVSLFLCFFVSLLLLLLSLFLRFVVVVVSSCDRIAVVVVKLLLLLFLSFCTVIFGREGGVGVSCYCWLKS